MATWTEMGSPTRTIRTWTATGSVTRRMATPTVTESPMARTNILMVHPRVSATPRATVPARVAAVLDRMETARTEKVEETARVTANSRARATPLQATAKGAPGVE